MWGSKEKRLTKFTIPLAPYNVLLSGKAQSWAEVGYQDRFRNILALEFIGDQFRAAKHLLLASTMKEMMIISKLPTIIEESITAPKRSNYSKD